MPEHKKVAELMTAPVVRVRPGTPFSEIVRLLQEYDITAVPVVDSAERPVGVVSEADLLIKEVDRWEAGRFEPPAPTSVARGKANAMHAAGLMTKPVICARQEWSAVQAAHVMHERRVKRLPVVDGTGRLVGIVSRADLLRTFLRADQAIRAEIIEDVMVQTLHESPSEVGVEVANGTVTLTGAISDEKVVPLLIRLCRSVDGVVEVDNRLQREAGSECEGRDR